MTAADELVELADRLISERLKLHLLKTSTTIGPTVDKRELIAQLEQKIAEIKGRMARRLAS